MWKNIPGTDGNYSCNELGQIRSNTRTITRSNGSSFTVNERILKPKINNQGYYYVSLRVKKKTYDKLIHRLIALTFIPNPENKKTVNHKDGNPLNNRLSNLEWSTQSEQNYHKHNTLGYVGNGAKPIAMLDNNREEIMRFRSCSDAGKYIGIGRKARGNISQAAKKNVKRYGFYWKFL